MKRHNSLIKLSKDHHQGLIVAQFVKRNAPAYHGLPTDTEGKRKYVLAFWKDDLRNHFGEEENILIPALSGADGMLDRLNKRVIDEHRLIENIIDELKQSKNSEDELDKFGTALNDHIRFEEREWFERIQETFSTDELNKIEEKLTGASH